jgi:uncharacterized membrane protein
MTSPTRIYCNILQTNVVLNKERWHIIYSTKEIRRILATKQGNMLALEAMKKAKKITAQYIALGSLRQKCKFE